MDGYFKYEVDELKSQVSESFEEFEKFQFVYIFNFATRKFKGKGSSMVGAAPSA